MKLDYTTANGRMHVTFEATSQVDLFKQLANFQEIFEDTECYTKDGKHRSDRVRFQVRTDGEGNEYFELVCLDTDPALRYAKKKFGQHKGKDQTLFPKSGWVKWDRDKKEEVEI